MKKLFVCLLSCLFVLTACSSSNTTCQEGDVVKIDFVGMMDGEEFSGGSASNQIVELGSGAYIDGFEDGIIGMKKGETKDVEMTFPETYYEDLAGKDVTFKITVKSIYKEVK